MRVRMYRVQCMFVAWLVVLTFHFHAGDGRTQGPDTVPFILGHMSAINYQCGSLHRRIHDLFNSALFDSEVILG